jgi:hypothetical protein
VGCDFGPELEVPNQPAYIKPRISGPVSGNVMCDSWSTTLTVPITADVYLVNRSDGTAALESSMKLTLKLDTAPTPAPVPGPQFFPYCAAPEGDDSFGHCVAAPADPCKEHESCSERLCPDPTDYSCRSSCAGAVACVSDADCPDDAPHCRQRSPGAFGTAAACQIELDGAPPEGGLTTTEARFARFGAVFPIPPTFSDQIDQLAALPGPGALTLPVTMQLLPAADTVCPESPP